MTSNEDLIAEARERRTNHPTQTSDGPLIDRLTDALEAAVKRAEDAEREIDHMEGDCTDHQGRMKDERDAYAAVVEKVRGYLNEGKGAYAPDLFDILASASADALREVKAAVWDEASEATGEHIENGGECALRNPYRQKREEQGT